MCDTMKRKSVPTFFLIAVLFSAAALAVEEYQGAEEMVLEGGRFGKVAFGHKRHQTALKACNVCHDLFPKTPGGIVRLKAEGRLYRRQVMNQCTSCHYERATKGKKTGPTSCGGCHRG